MHILITKVGKIEVSAITWTKNLQEGISYAKRIAKMRGYGEVFIQVA